MKSVKRYVVSIVALLQLGLLSCLGAGCSSGQPGGFDSGLALKLQQSLDRSVALLAIPGAVMAVRAPDGTTWAGASGHAVLPAANGSPVTIEMTTDLHFRIASTTKSLTATIILQLVDEGKLSLDETLDQIMARWFAPGYIDFAIPYSDTITLRNLMEMRSGMADYSSTAAFAALMQKQPPEPVDPRELIRMSVQSTNPASHAPDVAMEYCNTNFIMQGIIIEQVTDNSFASELEGRLLVPLGMTETLEPTGIAMPSPYAHGYLFGEGQLHDMTDTLDPSWLWSGGGIVSTIGDLRTWVTALVDGRMISPAMQQERMKMKPGFVETWPVEYGLGIYNDNGAIGHYGNCAKFYTTYAMRYAGYDIAVLTNGELQEHSDPERHPARSIFWNAVQDAGISP